MKKNNDSVFIIIVLFMLIYFICENIGILPIIELHVDDMIFDLRIYEYTILFLIGVMIIMYFSIIISEQKRKTKVSILFSIIFLSLFSTNLIDNNVYAPKYDVYTIKNNSITNVSYNTVSEHYYEYEINGFIQLNITINDTLYLQLYSAEFINGKLDSLFYNGYAKFINNTYSRFDCVNGVIQYYNLSGVCSVLFLENITEIIPTIKIQTD